ncbi:MAG: DUF11 domain-containing protein, partial [Deltaproteobacteria bacterium]|nr:DUF11 domain-containing protein [Deltaproteobacteria bacterium]
MIKIKKNHSFFIFTLLLLAVMFLFPANSRALVSIDEPMKGPAASGWILGGAPNPAVLTGNGSIDPVGNGWLRLTNTGSSQAGYAYFDTSFAISSGVIIQFDYVTWGGNGADGYSMFLFDAATSPLQIGASGGSLGYAQKTGIPGLSGGYIGVGIDEYGNFSDGGEGRNGGPGRRPNSVAVRGTANNLYPYIGGSAANVGQLWFNQATRPAQSGSTYRKVVILLTPVAAPDYMRADVYIQFGANQPLTPVATNIYTGQSIPAQVKVGFSASTGGSTNYHEIRNLKISDGTNLDIVKESSAATLAVGDPVNYTLTVRNFGPSLGATAINVPVSDPIPAEVTSVTWTCAGNNGATCGDASGAGNTLNTTATLPFDGNVVYTIAGTLTSEPATNILSNTATIDPAGATPPANDTDPSDNSDTLNIPIANPDLSTSTKTVVDLNGGDVEPGDTLRYTITLNETGADIANSVQVTDDIPANVTGFHVTGTPTGSTDNSTAGGGANGNGYLDISNISVAANGSETITFEVTVSGAIGDTIYNEATVINPSGPGATPNTATLFITSPASGLKQLYFGNGTELSRTPPTGTPTPTTINLWSPFTWIQTPALQAAVKIDPTVNATVPVEFYYFNNNTNIRANVTLACSGGGSITLPSNIKLAKSRFIEHASLNIPLNSQMTCAAGETWTLTINNSSWRSLQIYPVDAGISQVALPSINVINVDSVALYDAPYDSNIAGGGGNLITSATANDTVYIRSVVSDPFGDFDITAANLILTDAGGNQVLSPSPDVMSDVVENPVNLATKTYEYTYTIPHFPAQGTWTAQVEAFEGTEGTITHTGATSFEVLTPPLLTILKSANSPTASPGDEITYSVIITNTGGPATNVLIDDDMSPYTAWGLDSYGSGIPFSLIQLAPGSPADSGVTLGTPVYYDASGTVMTPVSDGGGAGAGFDGTVKRFELPMTGTMVPSGQFQLNYKVKV